MHKHAKTRGLFSGSFKNKLPSPDRLLAVLLTAAFYLYITFLLFRIPPFPKQAVDFERLKQIAAGNPAVLPEHGHILQIFKPYLPSRGAVSWIRDVPHGRDETLVPHYHMAENYLAPLIVNPEPGEDLAVIFCSSNAAADKRLSETGYEWLVRLQPGKGIARLKR